MDFKKFQEQFPAEQMSAAIKEANENGGGDYDKLPEGVYRCKIDKMEMRESRKGAPMCSIQFRITAGDYKKHCLFYNRVLAGTKNDGFMIKGCNDFLQSLDSGLDVDFKGWEQYNDLILDIFEAVSEEPHLEYMVSVKYNGDFAELTIKEVIG